jgi:hypothetical protein
VSTLSPDARAVVTAFAALTTQARRIADALTTPVVEVAEQPDDDATMPATTCSAQYHGPHHPKTACIRAAQHEHPRHSNGEGFHWPDAVAVYPVHDGPFVTVHGAPSISAEARDALGALTDVATRAVTDAASAQQTDFALAPPPDDEAQRTERRASLRNLLDRADRNHWLLPDEARMLREHVEAEVRESDTARAVARSNLRHVKTIVPELEQANEAARKALEQRQEMAEERYAWQQRGDRAEAEAERLRELLGSEKERADAAIRREETAEEAQAAIERVLKALDDRPPILDAEGQGVSDYETGWRDHDRMVRAALDGTEQQAGCQCHNGDELCSGCRRCPDVCNGCDGPAQPTTGCVPGPYDDCPNCPHDTAEQPTTEQP